MISKGHLFASTTVAKWIGAAQIDVEAGELAVDFEGREVIYDVGELDELVLCDGRGKTLRRKEYPRGRV